MSNTTTTFDRAYSGVGILIHKKDENSIDNIQDQLLPVALRTENQQLRIVYVYAPDVNKPK